MTSILQMKNPEAKKYKAHISIKQQNLGSSWDQPNPEHTLSITRAIYLNDVPAKRPFTVSGINSLPFFPCKIWPGSESPGRAREGELKSVLSPLSHSHSLTSSLLCELPLLSRETRSSVTSSLCSNHQMDRFLP